MSKNTTPQAAAVYCRISKDSQGKSLGVERQEKLCRELADQKGWPVAQVYVDNDLSAYSGKPRPGYEKMLADLEAGVVDGVVVVDQDRLTRHPRELEDFIIQADRLGIPLANVSGDIDLSSSDGRFRARIMGAVARQESEKKADRVKRQKDESAASGWWQGGHRPYGFEPTRTDDGHSTLTILEPEAQVVREMAERVLRGDSLRTIAADLNRRAVPTAGGNQWRTTTVRDTLMGASVAGMRVHRGKPAGKANWDAILSRATWEQVKAVLDKRGKGEPGRPSKHLLTGLLECSKCGGTLYYGKDRYTCVRHPNTDHCGGTSINAEPVERIITQGVLEILKTIEQVEVPDIDAVGTSDELQAYEDALDKLTQDYYDPGTDLNERTYLAARTRLTEQIEKLQAQIADIPIPTKWEKIEEHANYWREADLDERREAVQRAIERIVVLPATKRGKGTTIRDIAKRLEVHDTSGNIFQIGT